MPAELLPEAWDLVDNVLGEAAEVTVAETKVVKGKGKENATIIRVAPLSLAELDGAPPALLTERPAALCLLNSIAAGYKDRTLRVENLQDSEEELAVSEGRHVVDAAAATRLIAHGVGASAAAGRAAAAASSEARAAAAAAASGVTTASTGVRATVEKRAVKLVGLSAGLEWTHGGRKALLSRHGLLSVSCPHTTLPLYAVGNNLVQMGEMGNTISTENVTLLPPGDEWTALALRCAGCCGEAGSATASLGRLSASELDEADEVSARPSRCLRVQCAHGLRVQ